MLQDPHPAFGTLSAAEACSPRIKHREAILYRSVLIIAVALVNGFRGRGRERARLLLRRTWSPRRNHLRASHPALRKHRDGFLCGPLDPVRINDRGPFVLGPVIDVSVAAPRARHDAVGRRPCFRRMTLRLAQAG